MLSSSPLIYALSCCSTSIDLRCLLLSIHDDSNSSSLSLSCHPLNHSKSFTLVVLLLLMFLWLPPSSHLVSCFASLITTKYQVCTANNHNDDIYAYTIWLQLLWRFFSTYIVVYLDLHYELCSGHKDAYIYIHRRIVVMFIIKEITSLLQKHKSLISATHGNPKEINYCHQ